MPEEGTCHYRHFFYHFPRPAQRNGGSGRVGQVLRAIAHTLTWLPAAKVATVVLFRCRVVNFIPDSEYVPVEADARHAPRDQWFALGVTPRHEKVVSQLLHQKGYETFLPLYVRRHQYARRVREFELPLFPGYLFCRLDPQVRLPILTTPGVHGLIGAGRIPIPVDASEITALQRVGEAGLAMEPCSYWQRGQTGRITSGPLAGIDGIIVDVKNPVRLVLSVSLLHRSVLVEVDSGCVAVV
jgi:transcription antitermination factor NusG